MGQVDSRNSETSRATEMRKPAGCTELASGPLVLVTREFLLKDGRHPLEIGVHKHSPAGCGSLKTHDIHLGELRPGDQRGHATHDMGGKLGHGSVLAFR